MTCISDQTIASEAIGFTASATESRLYTNEEIALFDNVVTNYGGYYNPMTSSFICPVHGIYLFFVNTVVDQSNMQLRIVRNSDGLTTGWADGIAGGANHGSNLAITECDIGDVIWMRVHHSGDDKTLLGYSSPHTSFSGVLIKPM